eukprot:3209925-Rhodomonas_salina.1
MLSVRTSNHTRQHVTASVRAWKMMHSAEGRERERERERDGMRARWMMRDTEVRRHRGREAKRQRISQGRMSCQPAAELGASYEGSIAVSHWTLQENVAHSVFSQACHSVDISGGSVTGDKSLILHENVTENTGKGASGASAHRSKKKSFAEFVY